MARHKFGSTKRVIRRGVTRQSSQTLIGMNIFMSTRLHQVNWWLVSHLSIVHFMKNTTIELQRRVRLVPLYHSGPKSVSSCVPSSFTARLPNCISSLTTSSYGHWLGKDITFKTHISAHSSAPSEFFSCWPDQAPYILWVVLRSHDGSSTKLRTGGCHANRFFQFCFCEFPASLPTRQKP